MGGQLYLVNLRNSKAFVVIHTHRVWHQKSELNDKM